MRLSTKIHFTEITSNGRLTKTIKQDGHGGIGPNTPLYFQIELVEIRRGPGSAI